MRFGLIITLFVCLILGTMYMTTIASALMTQPSDGAVGIGIGIFLSLFVCWSAVVINLKSVFFEQGSLNLTDSARRWFKKFFLISSLCFVPTLSGCVCTRVNPGYVGIVINNSGSNKGVDDIPQQTGWVWYNPITETILEYPIFVKTAVWTKSLNEGNPANEELSFNSKKGLVITADVAVSYRINAAKVPSFYVKFRSDDLDQFSHSFLRNSCRDAFSEIACKYETEEIYGEKKAQILKEITDKINEKMVPIGVIIEQLAIIGSPRLPDTVIASINNSQAAYQKALQIENEIRQTKAEAQKKIAESQGQAQVVLQQARAAAEAKLLSAKAEAEANAVLAKSLSPELIRWRMISVLEKWDGRRPMVENGNNSAFMFQLPLAEPSPSK